MKATVLAPIVAVILAVGVVGGLATLSGSSRGGVPTEIQSSALQGAGFQKAASVPAAAADAQAIGTGLTNPSVLTALIIVLVGGLAVGGATAMISGRSRKRSSP